MSNLDYSFSDYIQAILSFTNLNYVFGFDIIDIFKNLNFAFGICVFNTISSFADRVAIFITVNNIRVMFYHSY